MDYTQVTETSGDKVTQEQIQRMYTRYQFARQYCRGKDVLELACGTGQGLGYLGEAAKTIVGGDYSEPILRIAQRHYRHRIPLLRLDAQALPFKNESFDVIVLFEAIYYLGDCEAGVREWVRVLRPHGTILICTANKDLPDFNPSPYSFRYFSPLDFNDLLVPLNFKVKYSGDCPVDYSGLKQQVISLIRRIMVKWQLMPKTMAGKKLLKRLAFGRLLPLPAELTEAEAIYPLPRPIAADKIDTHHKVIFVSAHLRDG